jgi:nucleoside-diphosphate-sugar epimerase
MRMLVTGAAGFTGARLANRLLDLGHGVTMLDLADNDASRDLEARGAKMIRGSVTDPETVGRAVEGQEVVFHLAAAFRKINDSPRHYFEVNAEGTRNVLAAAERHGVRKVFHCSTAGVHGGSDPKPWNEDSPIAPHDVYQASKWAGEQVCQEFIARGMDVTIVRPTSEYGPGDIYGMRFLFRLAKTGRFLMFGSGKGTVHPVYIDNLIDLFLLAMDNPNSKGRAYLAGDSEPCSLNDLVKAAGRVQNVDVKIIHVPLLTALYSAGWATEILCKPLKINPPLFRRRVHWFQNNRAYRIARAEAELGYRPAIPLEEGLRRTAAWYREKGFI